MEPLKKPLTYAEQVEYLQAHHGLEINNTDMAIDILKKVNYYRLSAYGIGLMRKDDNEKYQDGVSLDSLFRLYTFDSALRNLVIHTIEQIEIQLRTQISNYLALKYGAECYANINNFSDKQNRVGESIHGILVANFNKECDRQANSPFVKHHNKKYGGHFPIWVAVELFSFGNLSSMFSIMKAEDQKAIAALYNTDSKYLNSWLLALVEIRNLCAHYGRIYNMPLKQSPWLYSEHTKYRGNLNKLFPVIIVIKRMLLSDQRWEQLFNKLKALISDYSDVVKLSFIGFPSDWENVLGK